MISESISSIEYLVKKKYLETEDLLVNYFAYRLNLGLEKFGECIKEYNFFFKGYKNFLWYSFLMELTLLIVKSKEKSLLIVPNARWNNKSWILDVIILDSNCRDVSS